MNLEFLTNLLHSYEMHRHNLKTFSYLYQMLYIVHSSIRGHFLLLIYPPPTKGFLSGIGSFDLYQPIPDFSEYASSGGYRSSPILACVPYNIYKKVFDEHQRKDNSKCNTILWEFTECRIQSMEQIRNPPAKNIQKKHISQN